MRLLLSALTICAAGSANAVTLVFDHSNVTPNPDNFEYVGTEQGFTYDFSYTYLTGNHIALHDDSGLTSSTVQRQDGGTFTPTSVDATGVSRIYKTGSTPNPNDPNDYSWYTAGVAPPVTLAFYGVRDNQIVASQYIDTTSRSFADWGNTAFTAAFRAIDQLIFSLQFPAGAGFITDIPLGAGSNTLWCDLWCGEYWVDNLVVNSDEVAPVPLPASGLLLIGGLLGLLGMRRFNSVQAA